MARNQGLTPEAAEFEQYLRTLQTNRGYLHYTERTAHAYAVTMDRALRAGDPLAVLRAANTSAKWLLATNAVLAWADWKHDTTLRKSACLILDPLVDTKQVVPPTEAEWGRILAVIDKLNEPYRSILTAITTSGLRFGDVMHLTREQAALTQHNTEINIRQKGNKPRVWAVGTDTRNALQHLLTLPDWRKVCDLVDPHPATADISDVKREMSAYHRVQKALKAVCATAGVEYVRPHRFRHAVSVAALAKNVSIERRQRMLGHASYDTTNKYYTHTEAEAQITVLDSIIAGARKAGKS